MYMVTSTPNTINYTSTPTTTCEYDEYDDNGEYEYEHTYDMTMNILNTGTLNAYADTIGLKGKRAQEGGKQEGSNATVVIYDEPGRQIREAAMP